MSNKRASFFLGFAALAASLPLAAQTAPPAPTETPAYRSAFEGYRTFGGGEVQDWRNSNDTVRAVGGWRAYAREMQGAASAPAVGAPAPQGEGHAAPQRPVPASDPHAGHHP